MSLLLDTHHVFALAGSPGRLTSAELDFLAAYPDRFVVSKASEFLTRDAKLLDHPLATRVSIR